MTSWVYTDRVKDHFMNPRNVWSEGEDFLYNATGRIGNIMCGDEMEFYLRVDPETEVIEACRWKTFGCASAIASASVLSEMAVGKTLEEAYRISGKDINVELGGLPEAKVHCSVLGDKAMRDAVDDYYRRNGMEERIHHPETRIVCSCMEVTEADIEHAVLEGARTWEDIQEETKAGTGCGGCRDDVMEVMSRYVEYYFGG
jgi:NifU-like protein